MKFMNVCTKRVYKGRDGQEKTNWLTVGTMRITDDGKTFLELNMFPNTPLYVFEQKKKEESNEFSGR